MVVGRGVVVVVVEVVEGVVDVDVLVVVAENKPDKDGRSTCRPNCKAFCYGELILFPSNMILNYCNILVTFITYLEGHITRNL